MNDHLVLSSSYFNITGGRRQDSADTFRVLASLQTHSGEEAALYAVSEASTPGPMGARARRLVIDVIQGEYASRFDLGPAARLKRSVQAAHEELANEFKGHVRVGLTLLVAEDRSLYLLQVPPAQAYVRHQDDLHAVNSEPQIAATPFAHSLGAPEPPTISMFRDTMEASDIVVLCSSWFAHELEAAELREAFSQEAPDAITSTLFERARQLHAREVTCIALEAVPDQPLSMPAHEATPARDGNTLWNQVDEAVSSLSYLWGRALQELKAPSAGARPRTQRVKRTQTESEMEQPGPEDFQPPPTDLATEATAKEFPPTTYPEMPEHTPEQYPQAGPASTLNRELGTEELPILVEDVASWEEPVPQAPQPLEDQPEETSGPRAGATSPDIETTGRRSRNAELEEVNSFIQNTMNLGKVTPPVQGFPDMNVAPERIYPGSSTQAPRRPRRFGDMVRPARREGKGAARTPLLQPRVGAVSVSRRGLSLPAVPPAMWLWSSVGVALLVAIILAAFLFLGGGSVSKSATNYYVDRARLHARNAQHSSTPTYQAMQLKLAWLDIRKAKAHAYRPHQIRKAQAFVQTAANKVHHVTFPTGATAVAPFGNMHNFAATELAGGWPLLYVLDAQGKRVFSVDLAHKGGVKRIAAVGDIFTTGNPIVPWNDTRQITSSGDTLVAVDDKYNMITYGPGQVQPAIQQIVAPSSSTRIVASTTFGPNLYMLDPTVGQIWRYPAYSPTSYGQYATGYLGRPNHRLLARATSLSIDGSVYVALKGGRVLKFTNSRLVPFAMHVPFPLRNIADVYTRPGLKNLFILDPSSGRVLEIDKRVGYAAALTLPRFVRGSGPRQILVSRDGHSLYVLTHSSIYRLPIPH